MAVRRLDVADAPEDVLARVYDVMAQCHAEATPEAPSRSQAEFAAFLRHAPTFSTREYWIAEAEGDCVGFGQLAVDPEGPAARVEILVRPDSRRTGIGSALLEAVQRQAQVHGARVLIGSHATEAGSRFAAAAGAVDKHREVESLLRLPAELVATPVSGYRLRSWVGAAPPDVLDSFASAREAINDAPRAADEELAVWDGARVRELEAALELRDREVRVAVALDERGEVVAFTELRVPRARDASATAEDTAVTEDTAVVREHRRKGLARWVKVASLRRLQAERPDVTQITTVNAEHNEAIRGLNEALGFRPVAVWTTCVLET
jgi:GNAT superfamily N-acetyltransferase